MKEEKKKKQIWGVAYLLPLSFSIFISKNKNILETSYPSDSTLMPGDLNYSKNWFKRDILKKEKGSLF